MSGTSFDGVDAAIIKTDGKQKIEFVDSIFIPYLKKERKLYECSLIKNYIKILDFINNKHIKAIKSLLKKAKLKYENIDIIGLHGQTIRHKPEERWSWQEINSKKFVKEFQTNVISDFRLNDILKGGEGAPLVPIYHANIVKSLLLEFPIAIINIGGVCNVTVVKENGSFLGYDIGPGNGPIDKITLSKFKLNYDVDGKLSKLGNINKSIIKKIICEINNLPSKRSYDRKELDDICLKNVAKIKPYDALATITRSIADLIFQKINKHKPKKLILVGGGRKNLTLKSHLNKLFKKTVISAEEVGWDGDSLEAQAFAYLAVRCFLGLPITFPSTTGISKASSGGVLYTAY